MKKHLLALIALSFILISACEKSEKIKGSEKLKIYENSRFVYEKQDDGTWQYAIHPGDFLVFERKYAYPKEKSMPNSPTQVFLFQISKDAILPMNAAGDKKKFVFRDEELKDANPFVRNNCGGMCVFPDSVKAFFGKIYGERMNDKTWSVDVDVLIVEIYSTEGADGAITLYERSTPVRFKGIYKF